MEYSVSNQPNFGVRIHLYEGKNLVYKIAEAVPNTGSYDWIVHIPQTYSPDKNFQIEICWLKNTHICSRNEGYLRISHPSIG